MLRRRTPPHERAGELCDGVGMLLERELARVEQYDLSVRYISAVGLGAGGGEEGVVPSHTASTLGWRRRSQARHSG